MEPKEILIKKEQFIPIIKMFLEDVIQDKLLDKYSEQNLFDGYFSFRIHRIVLDDRLDINEYTGNLYPHFKVYYEGYMNSDWSRNVSSFIVVEINKYFSNLVVSPNASFNFIKLKI
jgi:hypothetical protein